MLNRAFRTALCAGAPASGALPARLRGPGGDFSVLVNGRPSLYRRRPLLKDGRSFLPMVETFDALGFAQGISPGTPPPAVSPRPRMAPPSP